MTSSQGSEPFRFEITSCFTITGRGTVIGGEIVSGVVHSGDVIDVFHDDQRMRAICRGVEVGHGRGADGQRIPFVGLWVPDIEKFEVAAGDFAVSVTDEE